MRRWWIAPLLAGTLGAWAVVGCDDEDAPAAGHEPGSDRADGADGADGAEGARAERDGERLYRRYCALCHGRDGEGYAADDAPSLASREWLRTASDEFITAAIRDGRPGTAMSAWSRAHGGPLSDPEIAAIVRYLRTWQREPSANVDAVPVEGDPRRGLVVYASHCAECHGASGEGLSAVELANPRLLATASDGFLRYAVAHGRTGTPMPAFSERLAPQQIDDVVAFVRSFQRGRPAPTPTPTEAPELPSLEDMPLVLNPDGPQPDFELRQERYVAAEAVHAAQERGAKMIILDARSTSDWLRSRIPGAIPVPFYEMDDLVVELPRDGTWMIAYCACPHAASGRVVDALRRHGFTNTAVLDEGIPHWEAQGWPTESGPLEPQE